MAHVVTWEEHSKKHCTYKDHKVDIGLNVHQRRLRSLKVRKTKSTMLKSQGGKKTHFMDGAYVNHLSDIGRVGEWRTEN